MIIGDNYIMTNPLDKQDKLKELFARATLNAEWVKPETEIYFIDNGLYKLEWLKENCQKIPERERELNRLADVNDEWHEGESDFICDNGDLISEHEWSERRALRHPDVNDTDVVEMPESHAQPEPQPEAADWVDVNHFDGSTDYVWILLDDGSIEMVTAHLNNNDEPVFEPLARGQGFTWSSKMPLKFQYVQEPSAPITKPQQAREVFEASLRDFWKIKTNETEEPITRYKMARWAYDWLIDEGHLSPLTEGKDDE